MIWPLLVLITGALIGAIVILLLTPWIVSLLDQHREHQTIREYLRKYPLDTLPEEPTQKAH